MHCLVLRCLQPNRHLLRVQILEDHLQRVFIQLPLASFIRARISVDVFTSFVTFFLLIRSTGRLVWVRIVSIASLELSTSTWPLRRHHSQPLRLSWGGSLQGGWYDTVTDGLFSPGDNICQTNHLCRLNQSEKAGLWKQDYWKGSEPVCSRNDKSRRRINGNMTIKGDIWACSRNERLKHDYKRGEGLLKKWNNSPILVSPLRSTQLLNFQSSPEQVHCQPVPVIVINLWFMMETLHWWNRRRTFHNITLSPEEWCSLWLLALIWCLANFDTNALPLLAVSPSWHFRNLIVVVIFRFSVGPT